jgi:hypothetical protein
MSQIVGEGRQRRHGLRAAATPDADVHVAVRPSSVVADGATPRRPLA